MKLLDSFHFRIATFFERSQMSAEMEEELRSHIQHRADDLEASGLPRAEAERRARVEFGGQEKAGECSSRALQVRRISGVFRGCGHKTVGGQNFLWHDDNSAPPVAIANQEFAREIFGSVARAVLGVVEDEKYFSLNEDRQPALFRSSLQTTLSAAYLVLRSQRDPQELAVAVRSKLREVDSGLPGDIQTWNSLLAVALFPARMATASLGVMGLMGAMLSITGIFGMAAYSVSKRIRELGIRIALGAQRREVLQAALGLPLKLLALGSAAGLCLGILATRVLAFIVYQATPRDPLVLAAVVLATVLVGLLATWIPAQRALSIDPLVLLRAE